MSTRRRVHIAGRLAAALVLFLFTPAAPVRAEGVPQHLASMAKALYAGVKGELNEATGDPQQDAIRRRARQILKDAGLRYWAQGEVRQEGAAAAVAKALEMDISKPDQWAMLRSILGESDRGKQIDKVRQWARDAGKPTEGPEFDKVVAKFDKARGDATKDMARYHAMEVGDNKDRLELDWDPINNGFEIRISARETSQGARDSFDLQLHGDVTSAPAIESDDTTLTVRPSDSAMSVLTDEELRRLQGTIFGKWRDGDGKVWEFSSAAGGGKAERPSERPEDRIAELERQIERIRSDKVFRWTNPVTKEVVVQDKFKQLKKPFKYLGEKFGRDSIWEGHLARELWATEIEMNAVLDEQSLMLSQVVNWKVGSQLMLNAGPHSTIALKCGDVDLFTGTMGQRNQRIAVRVDQRLIKES